MNDLEYGAFSTDMSMMLSDKIEVSIKSLILDRWKPTGIIQLE